MIDFPHSPHTQRRKKVIFEVSHFGKERERKENGGTKMVEGIKMRVVAVTPLQQQQSQLSVTICIPYYYLTFYNSKEKNTHAYCMEIRENHVTEYMFSG